MKRMILGIAIANVVLYFWGFCYWGLNPLPYQSLQRAADDPVAAEALRKHFPQEGTYLFPGMYNEEAARRDLYRAGPVAIIHLTAAGGREEFDAGIMLRGFLLNVVVVCLIALILRTAAAALPSYGQRVKFAALIGLACAFLADIGEVAWWDVGLAWNLHKSIYTVSAWVVTALVLAKFIGENSEVAS